MLDRIATQRSEVIRRFRDLNLHDCRLLEMYIGPARAGVSEVTLQMELVTGEAANEWTPARLRFLRCAALVASFDFWGSFVCDGAISDSSAEPLPDKMAQRLESTPKREATQPFARLVEFRIALCPPGGDLTIIAEDFALAGNG